MAQGKKKELDDAQKHAVKIDVNSVVSAGAGSGKTTVLAQRFSALLARDKDCRVEQILTLTFTNKATVEMNDRIYKQLKDQCPEKAKDFYKANIKTLDSYCAQVAKLGCNNYGISPDFSQDDESIDAKTKSLALQFLLKNRNKEVFSKLRGKKNYEAVATELFASFVNKYTTVVKPFDWDLYLQKQYEIVGAQWNKNCNSIFSIVDQILKLLNLIGNKNPSKYESELRANISSLMMLPCPDLNFSEYESEQRAKFLKAAYAVMKVRKPGGTSHTYDEVKNVHSEMEESLNNLYAIENYIYGMQFVNALIPYLNEFKQSVDDYKRKAGLLTFNDVSSLALDILENYPELRQVEKEKYKYIMIDEFQDNNEMQKKLLFMLSEKLNLHSKGVPKVEDLVDDKLFFVGDEKQSIYRFRGAEVSVFRSLAQDFYKGFLELQVNYRSHPALIAAFNSIFGGYLYPPSKKDAKNPLLNGVFYSESPEAAGNPLKFVPPYEAVYRKVKISESAAEEVVKSMTEAQEGNLPHIYNPRVTVAILDKKSCPENSENFLDADMSEAVWVTNKIAELIKEGYSENDIAILFRTLTVQPCYEKLLLKKGIAYKTEDVKKFFADGPVNDIISYLTLIAFTTDTFAFSNVLHSSFVNLSFAEIEMIMSIFDTSKNLFIQNAEGILNSESLERFNYAKQLYLKAIEISQNKSLADLISFLWYEAGYRFETLLSQRKFMYNNAYDRLFELARKADVDNLGLAEFLDCVSAYKDEKLDGISIPFEYADGVNLLTIHKSKGLEYPVVFIVGCGHETLRDNNAEMLFYSEDYGITVNTPPSPATQEIKNFFYEEQKELALNMRAAELRRLAYVAITRAEKKVYISGSCDFDKWIEDESDYRVKPVKDSFLDILKPSFITYISSDMKINPEFVNNCPFNFEPIPYAIKEEGYLEDSLKNKVIETFSPLFEKADVIEKEVLQSPYAKPSQLHVDDDESYRTGSTVITVDKDIPYSEIDQLVKDSISSDKNEPDFAYSNFGTIAHSYLECAVKKVEPQMLNREIVGLHGNDKKITIVDKTCRDMNDKFLKSDLGKLLLKTAEQNKFYKSEYTFKSRAGGKIINGQIDLVFENPDEEGYIVVDYKTNRKIEPQVYYQQLACYRDAVSKMTGVSEDKIKCCLYYLRYAKTVDITEECGKINLEDLIINSYN